MLNECDYNDRDRRLLFTHPIFLSIKVSITLIFCLLLNLSKNTMNTRGIFFFKQSVKSEDVLVSHKLIKLSN